MESKNLYEDNIDSRFILEHLIEWDSLISKHEFDFRDAKLYTETGKPEYELAPSSLEDALESYWIVLNQYGEICAKELAPVAKKLDAEGLQFEKGKVTFPKDIGRIINIIAGAGILGYSLGRKYGGLRFPAPIQLGILEILARADSAFCITVGCFNIAEIAERYASEKIKDEYLPKVTSGEMISAMALTEPDHGSDLANIQTKAKPVDRENGLYEITGTKRYITHGCGLDDKTSLIMTLARTDRNGARGLSFFLVKSSDVEIAGIENKLGIHTSPTCEVIYDKSKAFLIGEENKGLIKYAIEMMNGARLAIAIQAVGIAQAAVDEAIQYASERFQFGLPVGRIPAVRRLLEEAQAMLHAIRAVVYQASDIVSRDIAEKEYLLQLKPEENRLKNNERIRHLDKLAKLFTPISKYFASEYANKIVYCSVQVFGGAGFIEDYPIVKLYRDIRITTIYEGTSQLQVVGAIGGILEGLHKTSPLNQFLTEKINLLKNEQVKRMLSDYKRKLNQIILLYKKKEHNEKNALSVDIVDYFSVFWACLLLRLHEQKAEEIGSPVLAEKRKAVKNFTVIARRVMEGVLIQIQEKNFDHFELPLSDASHSGS